jgi:hypothetical protein
MLRDVFEMKQQIDKQTRMVGLTQMFVVEHLYRFLVNKKYDE